MKVLTRYLLRAHIGPFLFAFVALTGIILINTLAKELANLAGKGLPMRVVGEFFLLSLPANIALTLPMAVLVSVLYTFSTLASENEVTALRASGVDLRRAAAPLIVAAALIAGGMIWFSDQVLPASNYRWRVLMTDVAATRPLLALREQAINPIRTADGLTPYYLEAQEIDAGSGLMRNVSIYDVSNSEITRTINADSGRMVFNSNQTDLLLTLFNGTMREVDFKEISSFQTIAFEQQVMRMMGVSDRLERSAESTFRTDRDMTLAMMRDRISTLRSELNSLRERLNEQRIGTTGDDGSATSDEGELRQGSGAEESSRSGSSESPDEVAGEFPNELTAEMEAEIAAAMTSGGDAAPADLALRQAGAQESPEATSRAVPPPLEIDRSEESAVTEEQQRFASTRVRNIEGQIREYQVEIQKKYAIPVATLVFVLIGIPIALRFPSGGIGMVIGVSLAIFGIYYVGLIGGETLGDGGYVPPSFAMWITNLIFGALGVVGYMKLGREQGTSRGGSWGELPRWLRLRRQATGGSDTV